MAYPSVMAVLAVGVTIFLLTYILPKFEPLFTRKGVEAAHADDRDDDGFGPADRLLVRVARGSRSRLCSRGSLAAAREPGRKIIDWLKINTPIIGPMFRKVTISRSIRTLGTMVASGVSMLDAIRLTAEVSGNWYYEQAWLRVLEQVTEGHRICDALKAESSLFPSTLVQMIGAGEETGKLDNVLNKVSTYYDREVETSLKATTSMIEPLMICVMGVIVGGIALGLLMPIFSLSRPSG